MVRSSQASARVWTLKSSCKLAAFGLVWYVGVRCEFGTPTFIGLLIVAMFTCGTGKKWSSEPSAYSVFNGGERINGTLSADMLDGQMRNGGHAVRSKPEEDSSFIQNATRGWGGGVGGRSTRAAADKPVDQAEVRRRRELAAEAARVRAALSPTGGDGQATYVED